MGLDKRKIFFEWCGYKWKKQERWGRVHPDKSWKWFDKSAVDINNDGHLLLKTHHNPQRIEQDGETFYPKVGIGLVSCQEEMYHGDYEIEAKLPYGDNLWPAFWVYSWDSWPPEIDILEGYSDNNPNYFRFDFLKPLLFWNVQTNIHYYGKMIPKWVKTLESTNFGKQVVNFLKKIKLYNEDNSGNNMMGAKRHFFGFKDPTKHFIKYKLEWRKEHLSIYYNNKLVRKITDPYIMDQVNNSKMNVIINTSVTSKGKVNQDNPTESTFVVKYFKYTSHQ